MEARVIVRGFWVFLLVLAMVFFIIFFLFPMVSSAGGLDIEFAPETELQRAFALAFIAEAEARRDFIEAHIKDVHRVKGVSLWAVSMIKNETYPAIKIYVDGEEGQAATVVFKGNIGAEELQEMARIAVIKVINRVLKLERLKYNNNPRAFARS